MIGIVDYGAGNLTSVSNALNYLNIENLISSNPEELAKCERVIFPGVGAAGSSMNELAKRGLDSFLKKTLQSGVPTLGICVGCQIILDSSEEDEGVKCLGILPGKTVRFKSEGNLKIPHMGWNQVSHDESHPLFAGIASGTEFYFVHSFYPAEIPSENDIAQSQYGSQKFCAVHGYKNLVATQFHTEKSGEPGLKLLRNFSKWNP